MQFQVKTGLKANIPTADPVDGCWYLTTDTKELFICLDGIITPVKATGTFDPAVVTQLRTDVDRLRTDVDALSTRRTYNTRAELPSVGKEDIVYIVVNENTLYRWSNTDLKYYTVGNDYHEIGTIYGGTAFS